MPHGVKFRDIDQRTYWWLPWVALKKPNRSTKGPVLWGVNLKNHQVFLLLEVVSPYGCWLFSVSEVDGSGYSWLSKQKLKVNTNLTVMQLSENNLSILRIYYKYDFLGMRLDQTWTGLRFPFTDRFKTNTHILLLIYIFQQQYLYFVPGFYWLRRKNVETLNSNHFSVYSIEWDRLLIWCGIIIRYQAVQQIKKGGKENYS